MTNDSVTLYNGRLVAFLDVLGFRRRLLEQPLSELHERYAKLIDKANTTAFRETNIAGPAAESQGGEKKNFDYAAFVFDSVLLVSKELSGSEAAGNAFEFVAALTTLYADAYEYELPLRGAISYGDVLHDSARGVVLSAAIPELLRLEHAQEWSGCVIAPAAESCIARHLYGGQIPEHGSAFVLRYSAAMKPDVGMAPDSSLCLNWVALLPNAARLAGCSFLTEPKRANTVAFMEYVDALPILRVDVDEPGLAIVEVRLQVASAGMRIFFRDAQGNGVDPPGGFELKIAIPKNELQAGSSGNR